MLFSRNVVSKKTPGWNLIARQGTRKFMSCEFQLVSVPRRLPLCPHFPKTDSIKHPAATIQGVNLLRIDYARSDELSGSNTFKHIEIGIEYQNEITTKKNNSSHIWAADDTLKCRPCIYPH